MDAERANGNGNGELARQAHQDWGPAARHAQEFRATSGGGGGGGGGPLHRRLGWRTGVASVASGPREQAARAQADQDAARAGYAPRQQAAPSPARPAGFGQAAPVTRPLRGEFTIEQVRWIALYLADNRPFRWVVIPHETRIGTQRYYAEIVHIDYDRTHIARIIHDRAEFWRFLMDAEANDAPIHLPRTAATPLPAGHRR